MKAKHTTEKPDTDKTRDLLAELEAQETLMKAAQKFAMAFDQGLRWNDDVARLGYTLSAWRELALAAVDFAKANKPDSPK